MHTITQKVGSIVTNIGDSKEDVIALLRDLWHEIDYTSANSIHSASGSMVALAAAVETYQKASDNLAAKIVSFNTQSIPAFDPPALPESSSTQLEMFNGKERIDLQTSWAYRRPFGFTLSGRPYPLKQTWIDLYFSLLSTLRDSDSQLFDELPERGDFMNIHGNPYLSRDQSKLRIPMKISDSIFLESNLHANTIRDNIARTLNIFKIPASQVTFYLRE